MAAFLWGNRLLPAELADRRIWEVDLLFLVWGGTLVYTLLRPARQAWIELLWLAGALLGLLPLINGLVTERGLPLSLIANDWIFAGFDLTLLALAGLHALMALRTQRHQPKSRMTTPRSGPAPASDASQTMLNSAQTATESR